MRSDLDFIFNLKKKLIINTFKSFTTALGYVNTIFLYSFSGRKYAILKLKILLSTILRNYKMVSDITEDKFVLQADIILKRHDGFRVQIEPRKRVPSTA